MREVVLLACVCGLRHYATTRNKKNMTEKLELKKYCKSCRTREMHKEVKS